MSSFTVRVEMHGASSADYELLHEKMAAAGFNRFVSGIDASGNKGVWQLPTGEYDHESDKIPHQVRDIAKAIADSIRPNSWILVTESKDRSWNTIKVRSSG